LWCGDRLSTVYTAAAFCWFLLSVTVVSTLKSSYCFIWIFCLRTLPCCAVLKCSSVLYREFVHLPRSVETMSLVNAHAPLFHLSLTLWMKLDFGLAAACRRTSRPGLNSLLLLLLLLLLLQGSALHRSTASTPPNAHCSSPVDRSTDQRIGLHHVKRRVSSRCCCCSLALSQTQVCRRHSASSTRDLSSDELHLFVIWLPRTTWTC